MATKPVAPDPAHLEGFIGRRVKVTTRTGKEWVGVMRGARERGFTIDLTDGIGGRLLFEYVKVLRIDEVKRLRDEVADLAHANVMRIGEWETERRQIARLLGADEDASWRELKERARVLTRERDSLARRCALRYEETEKLRAEVSQACEARDRALAELEEIGVAISEATNNDGGKSDLEALAELIRRYDQLSEEWAVIQAPGSAARFAMDLEALRAELADSEQGCLGDVITIQALVAEALPATSGPGGPAHIAYGLLTRLAGRLRALGSTPGDTHGQ